MAATTQMMPPMAMAPTMPLVPAVPVTFRRTVVASRVAMAMPETGLLEDPMRPTIRDETAAKKKPKMTTSRAPRGLTGKVGRSQMRRTSRMTRPMTSGIGRSCWVRGRVVIFWSSFLPKVAMVALKVRTIIGKLLMREMTPPVATAPAPMYRT